MKSQTLEERIRIRAYELWLEDGSIEGCGDEYWHLARQMIEAECRAEAGAAAPVEPGRDAAAGPGLAGERQP